MAAHLVDGIEKIDKNEWSSRKQTFQINEYNTLKFLYFRVYKKVLSSFLVSFDQAVVIKHCRNANKIKISFVIFIIVLFKFD